MVATEHNLLWLYLNDVSEIRLKMYEIGNGKMRKLETGVRHVQVEIGCRAKVVHCTVLASPHKNYQGWELQHQLSS